MARPRPKYKSSNEYTKAERDYKLCKDVYDLLFFFGFWFGGGFPWLDSVCVSMGYESYRRRRSVSAA